MEAVEDGPREHLSQGARFTRVRTAQRLQVSLAVALVDDHRRVTEPDENEVENQPSGPAVAVEKGMDLLEPAMTRREGLRERASVVSRTFTRSIQAVISAGTSGHEIGVMPPGNGRGRAESVRSWRNKVTEHIHDLSSRAGTEVTEHSLAGWDD